MSATVAREIPRPQFVLIGEPRLSPRSSRNDNDRVNVVGVVGSAWQDRILDFAQRCNPELFKGCGCPTSTACDCPAGKSGGNPNSPNYKMPETEKEWAEYNCARGRWVPNTITNPAVVAAAGTGTATFAPQAAYKLARITLSAAQAADFTGISVAVGPEQNVLPSTVDGTYFSIAAGGDGYARIDCGAIVPGQTIVITFVSTAGVAAGAARFTLQGGYGGQNRPRY